MTDERHPESGPGAGIAAPPVPGRAADPHAVPPPLSDDAAPGRWRIPPSVRRLAVGVVIGRYLLALGTVVFLLPVLLPDRVGLLVLLQPRREWLLLGGARAQVVGDVSLPLLLAAYTPLMVLGVWTFFLVGRCYQHRLRGGTGPRWMTRALPTHKLELWQRLLVRRGPLIAVLGRVAWVPPTLLAAAAGVSDISPRRYLPADLLGAGLAFGMVVGVGYGLGTAYERAGAWVTWTGGLLFLALLLLAARWLRRQAARDPEPAGPRIPEAPET